MVALKRCLLPIKFSVADIADPDLCALDLDIFLLHPLLIAWLSASQPAVPLGRPAQKTVETGPHCEVSTIYAALSSNGPTTCRLYNACILLDLWMSSSPFTDY